MKKIILVFTCLFVAKIVNAQSWNLALNAISGNPNFGTSSNHPINFFTNNSQKMTLTTAGVLRINSLAGTGSRFLQTDANGNLINWTGDPMNPNNILFQDNTWRPFPFTVDGSNIFTSSGTKLGLGNSTPSTELDVNGGGQVANGFNVGEGLYIGANKTQDDYGLIRYIPAVAGSPAIFSFGGGGTSNPNNPNPGTPYHPFSGGHGGSGDSPDPQPDGTCINGTIPSLALFQNLLCVQKLSSTATPTSLGNINIGHDGNNAFIETQGTNTLSPNAGDLFINARCSRNVYVFNNGTSFAPASNNIMSISGKLNITQNVQIGEWSATNFVQNNSRLYVMADIGSASDGLRVKHGASGKYGVKIVHYNPNAAEKSFAVFKAPNSTTDGVERFTIQGDGRTEITAAGSDALVIRDANNANQINFQVNNFGNTFLGGGISSFANSQLVVAQPIPSYKALAIVDNSALPAIKEVFNVFGSGYTEININNPNALPDQVNAIGRVFAIKDKVQNKDIFVIKQNGKAYAREIEISVVTTFPDYVFSKDYKLKSLKEVSEYIQEYKHLPGFEKGDYYEKNGMNVNELLLKQQEKIEELTLYIIELEKGMSVLKKEMNQCLTK